MSSSAPFSQRCGTQTPLKSLPRFNIGGSLSSQLCQDKLEKAKAKIGGVKFLIVLTIY